MQDRPIIFVDAGGSEFPARAISFHRGEGFVAPGGHPALDLEVTLTPDAEAPEVISQVRHESFVEGSSGHHWKYGEAEDLTGAGSSTSAGGGDQPLAGNAAEPDGQKTVDLGSQPPAAGTTAATDPPKAEPEKKRSLLDKLRS